MGDRSGDPGGDDERPESDATGEPDTSDTATDDNDATTDESDVATDDAGVAAGGSDVGVADSDGAADENKRDIGPPADWGAGDSSEADVASGPADDASETGSDVADATDTADGDPERTDEFRTGRAMRKDTPYGDREAIERELEDPPSDASADTGSRTDDPARHGEAGVADGRTGAGVADGRTGAGVADGRTETGAHPDGGGDAVNAEPVQTYDPQQVPTGGAGAPDDQEMPLGAHIEEMVRRLGWVVGALIVVAAFTFPFADRIINFLWYSFMPGTYEACPPPAGMSLSETDAACPVVYHPLALMFARLKVAGLVGFVAALPVMVYQSYLFMRPGLYPRERRYYLASVPTSLILAAVGVAFAYFLVLPALFIYFTSYSQQAAQIAFGLTETFNLIVMMLGFFALVFQIPLFIMLAVMMGVTTRHWLANRRIYFWGGFATIAFVFSPDPTGMAPILVAVTMIALFEGTLLLLYWTGSASSFATPESLAARRPFAYLAAVLAGYLASTAPLPDSYYDQLPAFVTSLAADVASPRLTPLVIGGVLIAAYELALWLYRRYSGRDRVSRTGARARVFVWPVSLLVGYFGSPDPVFLRRVDAVDLAPVEAAGLAVGLVVAYELLVLALRWRANRRRI